MPEETTNKSWFPIRKVWQTAVVLYAALIVCAACQCAYAQTPEEQMPEEVRNYKAPLGCKRLINDRTLQGIKHIVIVVRMANGYMYGKEKETLPEPLRKENLENLLKISYMKRVKKHPDMAVPNCYNRENQTVTVMDFRDDRETLEELSRDPETMIVYFNVSIQEQSKYNPYFSEPLFIFSLTNFKNGQNIKPIWEMQHQPWAINFNTDPFLIEKNIRELVLISTQ